MKKAMGAAALVALAYMAQPAYAQDTLANSAQDVVSAVQPVHIQAKIVAIDTASRTVTLQGPNGRTAMILVSDEVPGFDKLKVGDNVDAEYKNALLVTAEKVKGADKGIRERVDTQVYQPASGGYQTAKQIEVLATVQKIDRKKRMVTLRGAYQTQTLDVGPDIDLKSLKVGDTVHAVFVSAAAVKITPSGASTTAQ
ncbi:copper-binding protein [Paraburkholderia edwinii]|jgi:Cu/Ag efflux protein CusF|uniref:Copper-binding protein n=1 Tax=Paraburkholderia edwinii TaxID=2861782 RepID=A0ABX8UT63_9BURK|nr:copper-binding protein [Paraburkholderia edwinii]QYD72213.1 copper-binding protein [Paraburkholderia edwinii]